MAAFSVLRKFLLFFCLLCLSLPALAQTLQDELLKVREALETASTADEQKALEDYLRIRVMLSPTGTLLHSCKP